MLITVWLILIILGFCFKKNKSIVLIQIIAASLLIACNVNNPDYGNGVDFIGITNDFSLIFKDNIIYNLLFYIFGKFTTYDIAVFFISVLSYFLVYKFIIKYTEKVAFVFSFYLISPFVIDATQFKNFVAMSVWIYSMQFLINAYSAKKSEQKKLIVLYCIGCLIAAGIHFSFLVCFIYVLVIPLKKRGISDLIKIDLLIALFKILMDNFLENILGLLSKTGIEIFNLLQFKLYAYSINYDTESAQARVLATLLCYVIIGMFFVFLKLLKKIDYSVDYSIDSFKTNYASFCLRIVAISVVCLPLISFSMEIYRIQRNLLLMLYVLIALVTGNNVMSKSRLKVKSFTLLLLGMGIAMCYLLFDSIIWNYDTVFRSLFRV